MAFSVCSTARDGEGSASVCVVRNWVVVLVLALLSRVGVGVEVEVAWALVFVVGGLRGARLVAMGRSSSFPALYPTTL